MSARRPGLLLRLIIAALVLAVIGGGGWVAFSGVLGPDRLKAELQRAAFRATGRDLTIGGTVHVSLGLAPGLTATDVALANMPGGSRPAMATAARITAQVALLPLLAGDLVFESVTIEKPDILLERAADGTPNWSFAAPKRALYQAPTAQDGTSGAGGGGGGSETEIDAIHVDGGQIVWRTASGVETRVGIGGADMSADSVMAPMKLAMRGDAGGVGFTLNLQAGSFDRLRGGPTTALAGSWPLTVDMAGAGASLHMEGGFTHPDQARAYDFRITANVPDLAALQPAVPAFHLPPLHEVNFTTRVFDGTDGDIRTSGLSLHAGASELGAYVPGLSIKDATLSAPGPGQLVQASVDGVYQGTVLHVAGTGTQPDFLALTSPIPAAITAEIASATFSAKGTVPPGLGMSGLDMTVSARVPDLAALVPLVGRPLPPAHDVAFDAKIGDAGYKLRGVALRDIVLASSLGDLAGNVTVAWAPVLDLRGMLQSKTLDLDRLGLGTLVTAPAVALPMPMPKPGAAAVAARPRLFADTPLPIAMLRGADADLSLTLETVIAGGETLHDFQARLQAADGKLVLNPFRVTAPEGAITGGVTIDASTDTPPVAINLRSPGLSSAALAAALGYPGAASGPLQVDAVLSGVGASTQALLASLSGHLGLSMVDGQVSDGVLTGLLGSALGDAGLPDSGEGTSKVRCFAMRADMTDGHGSFRALALDTSRLSMDGDGQFDLESETLNLHMRPKLLLGVTAAAAPVSVKGSFAAPRIALDPVLGGRVGISIGGTPGTGSACANALRVARGGMAGPQPAPAAAGGAAPLTIKKPVDLLRGLFHH